MARKSAKLAWAVIIAVLVAGILAVYTVPRVRKYADRRIETVISSLQDTVFSITGLRLGYGYAALSSSSRVSIHDIELFQETADDYSVLRRKVISAGDLELRIDLWAAIFGKPADIIREIRVSAISIDLEFPDDFSIYNNISKYLADQPAGEMPRLSIDLSDISIGIRDGERGKYGASISSLQVSTISGLLELVAPSAIVFASVPAAEAQEVFLQVTMARVSMPSDSSGLTASLGLSARYGTMTLAEQKIAIAKSGEKFELKLGNGNGLEGVLRYTPGQEALDGEIRLKEYRPEADLSGFDAVLKDLFGLKYQGEVLFSYGKDGLSYEGRLQAAGEAGKRVGGLSAEGAELEAVGKGNAEGLEELRLRGRAGDYTLAYEGPLDYQGLKIIGAVSLSAGDETVRGELKGENGSYALSVGDAVLKGFKISDLMAGVEKRGDIYSLRLKGELEKDGQSVSLDGTGKYGTELSFKIKLAYQDRSYLLEGTYGKGLVSLNGGYGLSGEVRFLDEGAFSGSIKAQGLPLAVDGGVLYLDLSLRGNYAANGIWKVEGDEVRVRYEGKGEIPAIGLKGLKLDAGKLSVKTLSLQGNGYGLSGGLRGSYGEKALEGSASLVGEGMLGGGTARYELSLGYGEGSGKLKLQVDGYDLGLIGVDGYRAKALLEGSGELSLEELLRGEYGRLDGWVLKGKAGLAGSAGLASSAVSISDQRLELSKAGKELSLKIGNGRGFDAILRYALGEESVTGAVTLKGYKPEGDVLGLAGALKELLALRYDGGASFAYDKSGLRYEGDVFVKGETGQKVSGLPVAGASVELAGKGNERGFGEIAVKGILGDYRIGYEGSFGYEGLAAAGEISLSKDGEALRGTVKGERGTYDVTVGAGLLGGVELKNLTAGIKSEADRYGLRLKTEIGAGRVEGDGFILKGNSDYEWRMNLQDLDMLGILSVARGFGVQLSADGIGQASLSGSLSIKGDKGKSSWAAFGMEGALDVDGTKILLTGSGSGDESWYEIRGLEAEVAGETVSINGKGEFGALTKFAGNLGYRGVNYRLEGTYSKGLATLKGEYGLDAEVVIGKDGTLKGSLKARAFPLALDEGRMYGDLSLRGFYGADKAWRLEGDEIALRYEGNGAFPALWMNGLKVSGGVVDVAALTLRGEGYGLSGSLSGSFGAKGIEGRGHFIGEGSLGSGLAQYNLDLGYGEGQGRLKIGLSGYDLGIVGLKGFRAHASLEGSGELSPEELLRGELGKLDGWVLRGKAGLEGDALTLNDQDIEISKAADLLSLKVGNGKGFEGLLRYSLDGKELEGQVLLAAYRPEGDIATRIPLLRDLSGLLFEGGAALSYGESGLSYEGQILALGEASRLVGGVSTDGARFEAAGKGDGIGLAKVALRGVLGTYELSYDGLLRYEGLKVAGGLSFSAGADIVQGNLKGEKGIYELTIGQASIMGIGIRGLAAGLERKADSYGLTLSGELEKDGETVRVKATGEYGTDLKFAAELGYRGVAYGLDGTFENGQLTMKGGYGLVGKLVIGEGKAIEGSLSARDLPLAVDGGMVYGNLSLRGAYGKDRSWWVEGDEVGLRYEGKEKYPILGMKGLRIGGGRAEVDSLTLEGEGYGLSGSLKGSYGGEGTEAFEGSGIFIGEKALGGGSAIYELSFGYGEGRGRIRLGVDGYDLGFAGLKGYRANASLAGSGDLSWAELVKGELGKLDTWVMRGKAGLFGDAMTLSEQGLELRKIGDLLTLSVGNKNGFEGAVSYALGAKSAGGEILLDGYSPEKDLIGLDGILKDLLGLKYGGKAVFAYGESGLTYAGDIVVQGEAGRKIGGQSVEGMLMEVIGKGDLTGLGELTLKGSFEGYTLGYGGSLSYEGMKVAGALSLSKGEEAVLGFVKGEKGAYELSVGDGTLGGIRLQGLLAAVEEKEERYDIRLNGELAGGKIEAEGSLLKGKKGYEGRMSLQDTEIMGLLRLAEVFGLKVPEVGLKKALVSGGFSLSGDYEKVAWAVGNLRGDLELDSGKVVVKGSGIGDGSKFEIKDLILETGAENISVKGSGEYGAGIKFAGDVGFRGMNYGVEGAYENGLVKLKGDYGLEGEAQIGDDGTYKGSLKAKGFPLTMSDGLVYGDLSLRGTFGADKVWRIDGDDIGLRYEYEGEYEYPTLGMKGVKISEGRLDVGTLTVTGKDYGLSGYLNIGYKNLLTKPAIALDGSLRNSKNVVETYNVSATYVDGIVDAKIGIAGFPLERYVKKDIKGAIEGTISILGPLDQAALKLDQLDLKILPPAKLDVKLIGGEYRNIPIKMTASGSLEKGLLKIVSPKIDYLNHQAENISAAILPAEGRINLSFDYRTVLGSERLETSVVAEARIHGASADASANASAEDKGFSAEFSGKLLNAKYRETLVDRWEFSGTYGNGNLSFNGDRGGLMANIGADGAFDVVMKDRFPVSATIKGTMSSNIVTASMENLEIDLKKFSSVLPTGKISLLDGVLTGDLMLKGPLSDPEINGALTLKKAKILSRELVLGELGPFSTTLNFTGKNIEMAPATVPLEKGVVEVSASGLLDQWALTDLKFNVVSQKDSVVNVSTKIAGITVVDAKAQVDMVLSIENDVLVAEGSVYLERGQVMIDPQGFQPENAAPVDPDALAFRIKAAMTFGKQLEVYLPDNKIPLVRGYTSPGSYLTLQYDSASQDFSLDGKIDLRTGYVLYYLRSFFLKSGSIYFSENSTKFNPLITVAAELRESNALGTVKIMLNAENSPLEHLNPTLSSVPFYSETQLIAMMSGGVLAADTSETLNIREAAIASSEFIPQFNIFKSFERKVQTALGLDIVFIRSSFMQRWLLDLTKPATEANPEDPLARYLDQSELYVGKYITDSAFLHAGLKFREDPLVSSSRLRLDSEFGIELDSPMGLINWSITPSIDEGSLVTGQELSLSWRYVY